MIRFLQIQFRTHKILFYVLLVKCTTLISICGVSADSIELDDILRTEMMPLSIFLQRSENKISQPNIKDLSSVLQLMGYHRKMMQQFMASEYLTQQILSLNGNLSYPFIMKRIGNLYNNSLILRGHTLPKAGMNVLQSLIFDDGSVKYNDWLKRTTTLGDIQNRINMAQNKYRNAIRRQTFILEGEDGEDVSEDGDVTGYAFDEAQNRNNYSLPNRVNQVPRLLLKNTYHGPIVKELSKSGYETGYDDYVIQKPPLDHTNQTPQPASLTKEISLKDITDIALTTLAFLSFGMFILQILMCITMSKDDSSNLMMLPMEATESSETNDGTEEIRRRKRSTNRNQSTLNGANGISKLLLKTLDKLYLDEVRNTDLKHDIRLLCDYALMESSIRQTIWTTLYSLGTSWLAARLSRDYVLVIKHLANIFEYCA